MEPLGLLIALCLLSFACGLGIGCGYPGRRRPPLRLPHPQQPMWTERVEARPSDEAALDAALDQLHTKIATGRRRP